MKKIAIIGSGIAGMSCAYFLKDFFQIKIFEKNNYIGGHSNTLAFNNEKISALLKKKITRDLYVDSGFIVFNKETYPLLTKLFNLLDVKISDSDMSFSAKIKNDNIEYAGGAFISSFRKKVSFLIYAGGNFC